MFSEEEEEAEGETVYTDDRSNGRSSEETVKLPDICKQSGAV